LQDFVAWKDDGAANFSWHKRCDIFSSSVARIAAVLAIGDDGIGNDCSGKDGQRRPSLFAFRGRQHT